MSDPTPGEVEVVPISDLQLDPKNARFHGPRNLEAIRASLREFGQQHPILVDLDGVVIAGNGRVEAMRLEGWTECEVRYSDLAGDRRQAFALADNKTASLAEWEDAVLGEMLGSLDGDLLTATGFDENEVYQLLGDPNADPTEEWRGMPEFQHEDQTSKRRIIVHFASDEDALDFARRLGQTITDKTRSMWHPEAEIGRTADKHYSDDPKDPSHPEG